MASQNIPIPGRTYDILAMRGPDGNVSGRQTLSLTDGSDAISATGIVKLSQRVLLEFLTATGSMLLLPSRGSGFLTAVQNGGIRTDTDVYQQFAFAANTVMQRLAADATATDPTDELLETFELNSLAITPGRLVLNVTIESKAGTNATLLIPITTSP